MQTATPFRMRVGVAAAAMVLLAVAPAPAAAQSRTVVLRGAESPFELEVDRLVQELLQKRRVTLTLLASLQDLQLTLRSPSLTDAQRAQVEGALRQTRGRLVALESEGARIRSRLGDICESDRKPEGWVGVAYSGSASAIRQDDGRVIMRFVDYPSIESVEPGSPADQAGLRGGDRILSMAGTDLRDAEIDFTPLLKPGARIAFKVRRGVETKLLTVNVEPRPDDFSTPCPWVDERIAAAFAPMQMTVTVTSDEEGGNASAPTSTRVIVRRPPAAPGVAPVPPVPPTPPLPATPRTPPLSPFGTWGSASTVVFGGAQFAAVGPELADALGVERGLLVLSAGRGSPAERSGLRPGDVLVSVDGQTISSPLVFLQAVEQSTRRELPLQLLRKRKPLSAVLKW